MVPGGGVHVRRHVAAHRRGVRRRGGAAGRGPGRRGGDAGAVVLRVGASMRGRRRRRNRRKCQKQKQKTKSRRQLLAAAPRLPRVRGLEHQGGRAAAGQRVDPADGRHDGQRVHVRPPAATRFVLVGFQTPRPSHPRAARGGRRRDASVRCVAREADDREGWVGVRVGRADGALGGRVRPA